MKFIGTNKDMTDVLTDGVASESVFKSFLFGLQLIGAEYEAYEIINDKANSDSEPKTELYKCIWCSDTIFDSDTSTHAGPFILLPDTTKSTDDEGN